MMLRALLWLTPIPTVIAVCFCEIVLTLLSGEQTFVDGSIEHRRFENNNYLEGHKANGSIDSKNGNRCKFLPRLQEQFSISHTGLWSLLEPISRLQSSHVFADRLSRIERILINMAMSFDLPMLPNTAAASCETVSSAQNSQYKSKTLARISQNQRPPQPQLQHMSTRRAQRFTGLYPDSRQAAGTCGRRTSLPRFFACQPWSD